MKIGSEKISGDILPLPKSYLKVDKFFFISFKFRCSEKIFQARKGKFVVFSRKKINLLQQKFMNYWEPVYFAHKTDLLQLLYPLFKPDKLKPLVHLLLHFLERNELSFIETSALDSTNVEVAFRNILDGKHFFQFYDGVCW